MSPRVPRDLRPGESITSAPPQVLPAALGASRWSREPVHPGVNLHPGHAWPKRFGTPKAFGCPSCSPQPCSPTWPQPQRDLQPSRGVISPSLLGTQHHPSLLLLGAVVSAQAPLGTVVARGDVCCGDAQCSWFTGAAGLSLCRLLPLVTQWFSPKSW